MLLPPCMFHLWRAARTFHKHGIAPGRLAFAPTTPTLAHARQYTPLRVQSAPRRCLPSLHTSGGGTGYSWHLPHTLPHLTGFIWMPDRLGAKPSILLSSWINLTGLQDGWPYPTFQHNTRDSWATVGRAACCARAHYCGLRTHHATHAHPTTARRGRPLPRLGGTTRTLHYLHTHTAPHPALTATFNCSGQVLAHLPYNATDETLLGRFGTVSLDTVDAPAFTIRTPRFANAAFLQSGHPSRRAFAHWTAYRWQRTFTRTRQLGSISWTYSVERVHT